MRTKTSPFVCAFVFVSLLSSPLAGQSLRTPWGDPDLQGIWSNPYVIPLQRPKEFGTREFLTKEEIAAAEQKLAAQAKLPGRDARDGTGTEKDVARAYNNHWFGDPSLQRGTRTSLIVDPPDGRIPALTPEAQKRIGAKKDFLDALLQGFDVGGHLLERFRYPASGPTFQVLHHCPRGLRPQLVPVQDGQGVGERGRVGRGRPGRDDGERVAPSVASASVCQSCSIPELLGELRASCSRRAPWASTMTWVRDRVSTGSFR